MTVATGAIFIGSHPLSSSARRLVPPERRADAKEKTKYEGKT